MLLLPSSRISSFRKLTLSWGCSSVVEHMKLWYQNENAHKMKMHTKNMPTVSKTYFQEKVQRVLSWLMLLFWIRCCLPVICHSHRCSPQHSLCLPSGMLNPLSTTQISLESLPWALGTCRVLSKLDISFLLLFSRCITSPVHHYPYKKQKDGSLWYQLFSPPSLLLQCWGTSAWSFGSDLTGRVMPRISDDDVAVGDFPHHPLKSM